MKYLLLLLFPALSYGQKTYNIFSIPKANKLLNVSLLKVVEDYTLLNVNTTAILKDKPDSLYLPIIIDGKQQRIKLKRKIYNTKIILSNGNRFYGKPPLNYVYVPTAGNRNLCAITFTKGQVTGLISNKTGNHVIGKYKQGYIMYNDRDVIGGNPFVCGTETKDIKIPKLLKLAATTNKCVNIYWETDYNVFQNKGSVQAVTDWVQAVFNQVATIYANDGMSITLKTLFVWTTPSPYSGSAFQMLDKYMNYRTSGDDDLSVLISFGTQGGVASVEGLCDGTEFGKKAYCGVRSSYSTLPAYSWTVGCIAHEMGHVVGSPHTHDCYWNGNRTEIDGCGDVAGYKAGSCPTAALPIGGGTIMSYCHLIGTGVNFSKGFGEQPTALMRYFINNAACLSVCGTNPPVPPPPPPPPPPPCTIPIQPSGISGQLNVLQGSLQTYSITPVLNAVSYNWITPVGWSWTTSTDYTTLYTMPLNSGNISVSSVNSCGQSSFKNLSVNVYTNPVPIDSCTGTHIQATIDVSRPKDYKAVAKFSTNWKYKWYINGIFKTTSQLLLKSLVHSGDTISLEISSLTVTNPKCFGRAWVVVP